MNKILGGGNGGAGGIFDRILVGAPGGAEDMDDVELFGDPKKENKWKLNFSEITTSLMMTSS